MNVNPNVLLDKDFESGVISKFIKKYGLEPKDIVFEITERTPIQSELLFKDTLNHYKEQGYLVALDDFGSAYAGLERLLSTKPDFVKFDISMIRNVNNDKIKQSLLRHMVDFCKEYSIRTIAEGIETEEEITTLKELGIDMGQGFYYSKPVDNF